MSYNVYDIPQDIDHILFYQKYELEHQKINRVLMDELKLKYRSILGGMINKKTNSDKRWEWRLWIEKDKPAFWFY
jgi:hypothetical protein